MKTSPTQRSLKLLRSQGYLVAIVEHWNSYVKIRQDLWGFADLLAVRGDDCLLVQTTSGPNVSARIAKIQAEPKAALWLQSSNRRIVVHGWRKVGARGKRKLWECREEEIHAVDRASRRGVHQSDPRVDRAEQSLNNL